jgi:formylglycine-generating enzyme required for sulfatase activity
MRVAMALAFGYALMQPTLAIKADESQLRVSDDCVVPLVRIAPGKFEMGRSSRGSFAAAAFSLGDQGDWATEGPVRRVTISKPFFEQFCKFLNLIDHPDQYVRVNKYSQIEKNNGEYVPKNGKDDYPINVVHWDGAVQFCKWLSKTSGREVRLPTEAEWEYVARGDAGRRRPWGTKEISSWTSPTGAAVDAFPENATTEGVVGMVDAVVGEWCSDYYGVRYIPNDAVDPQGPSKQQLPIKSDLDWLATVEGEYHVQRGRVRRPDWSTTSRSFGDRVGDDAGIYGFRVVVEVDDQKKSP